MSNTTQHSRQSPSGKRRRSRGGRNQNQSHHKSDHHGGKKPNRADEFHPQAPRRTYAPPKLTWWQKLLQLVGLYKAPTPPSRKQRREGNKDNVENRSPKSNVRNARSEGQAPDTSNERPSSPKRGNRGERGERPSRGGDVSSVESSRVYVGNLSYEVTEQDLQELFKGVGPVRSVEIVYNRSTHRSKGYGFVEMLHKDEAIRSVEVLHDQHFMGRKLVVSGAKSKGQDEREEREERQEQPRKVTLAPLPPRNEETAEAKGSSEKSEPVIQTIIEKVPQSSSETKVEEKTFNLGETSEKES